MSVDDTILEWEEAKNKLKFYQQLEKSLRIELGNYFGIDKMAEGTNHRQTENYMVEVKRNFNYKVSQADLDDIYDDLDDTERACFKTTTSLVKSKYNDLFDTSMVDDAITVDDALLNIKVTPITE